jgi:L-lactate dehydrogenase complex protein LldE
LITPKDVATSGGPPPEAALFVTCLVDQFAPEAGMAAVRLLEASGCRVVVPDEQSCCGQPALNTGEPEAATVLARHHIEVFEPYEAVITPSGSCAAMVRHWYPRLFVGHDGWAERARIVAGRTHELSGYLVDGLGRKTVRLSRVPRETRWNGTA